MSYKVKHTIELYCYIVDDRRLMVIIAFSKLY
jgi:hypothetical protein